MQNVPEVALPPVIVPVVGHVLPHYHDVLTTS